MTKRKEEQLARLLAEKEQEERHDHEFFAEARRRRGETLRVLGIDAEAAEIVQRRAAESGIGMQRMLALLARLTNDWLQKNA